MKLRRNRRLANFTKSAITIGILLPIVPLHYRCLPYTLGVPFLALTLQRSAFSGNTDRPNVFFCYIFQKLDKSEFHQNYANEPCFQHLLTYRSSKHQSHYLQSTVTTFLHYPYYYVIFLLYYMLVFPILYVENSPKLLFR